MPPAKILVVDDHPVIRAGIRAILASRADWHVCGEADNGDTAVRSAVKLMPDVAIIDYSLPVMNGLETTRKLRRANPDIEVLIYTMHDDETLIRDALRAGARGYLLKSEDDSELISAVDALTRGKTYFSQRVTECLLNDFLTQEKMVASQTLTAREREVVQLVAEGTSNKGIAARWGVSIKTVDTHRTSAMRKLNLRTAVDLARYAIRNKLIEP